MSDVWKCINPKCQNSTYEDDDEGQRVCKDCGAVDPDYVAFEDTFNSTRVYTRYKEPPHPSTQENAEAVSSQKRCLFFGFNKILLVQVDALVEQCGAPFEIKKMVAELWAAYLSRNGVATKKKPGESQNSTALFVEEKKPEKLQSPAPDTSGRCNAPASSFIKKPRKVAGKKERVPDDQLTKKERRKQMLAAKRACGEAVQVTIPLPLDDVPKEGSYPETSEALYIDSNAPKPSNSRLESTRTTHPELFKGEKNVTDALLASGSKLRNLYTKIEYMTAHKLLAFLHGALLLKGTQIYDHDLIRLVQEGFIPLHGAHQLLPDDFDLGAHGKKIFGGANHTAGRSGPCLDTLRSNTAKLFHFLGIKDIPKPPVDVIASRIIQDLQLPVGLIDVVLKLDSFIADERQKWERLPFGGIAESGTKYVACLILIGLKMTLGFDGHSESSISDFALTVNVALKLKPSSSFTARNDIAKSNTGMATLFVYKEWVRFMDYRRTTMARHHVPSAIRTRTAHKMADSSALLEFCDKPTELRFDEKPSDMVSHQKSRQGIKDLLVEISERIQENNDAASPALSAPAKISLTDAFIVANDGMANILLTQHPEQFPLLRQSFPDSSLAFIVEPKNLAGKLQTEGFNVNVCRGSAYSHLNLYTGDFVAAGDKLNIEEESFACCSTIPASLNPQILPVIDPPIIGNKDLLLHQPSWSYWSRDVRAKAGLNPTDWAILKQQLPDNFVWLLELVAGSVGEKSSDLYLHLVKVEKVMKRCSTKDLTPALTTAIGKKENKPKFHLY